MYVGRGLPPNRPPIFPMLPGAPLPGVQKNRRVRTLPLHIDPHAVKNDGSGVDVGAAVAASALVHEKERKGLQNMLNSDYKNKAILYLDGRRREDRHNRKKPLTEDDASKLIRDLSHSLNNGDRASLEAFLSGGMPTISCQDAYKAASLSSSLESLRLQAQQLLG